MIRILVLVLATALVVQVVASCGPEDAPAPAPAPTPPVSSQRYAADGSPIVAAPILARPRNLVLVLLDTVRRDAVSLGSEGPRLMPQLSQVARTGVGFTQATTPASWTIPTVASVLTGLHPSEHGLLTDGPAPKLADSITTYAEVLSRSYGYQTAAFSDLPWFRGAPGSVMQGFRKGSAGPGMQLRRAKPLESGYWLHGGDRILDPWLETLDRERPFFLFLHTYDAHDPFGAEDHPPASLGFEQDPAEQMRVVQEFGSTKDYTPGQILELSLSSLPGRFALQRDHGNAFTQVAARYAWEGWRKEPDPALADRLRATYEDGVRWTDEGVGKLVAWLDEEGLLEDTLLVFFSDHGEAFGEHGLIGHGRQLDEELVHVPLLCRGPAPFDGGTSVDASVGVIDILPTFMEWIGAPDIQTSRGRSFLPLLSGSGKGRAVLSEATVIPEMTGGVDDQRLLQSVRDGRHKYVVEYYITAGRIEERLFDLASDPTEATNLLTTARGLETFRLDASFCASVELARDRIWSAAEGIRARILTPYGAGVAITEQPRPPPCGK